MEIKCPICGKTANVIDSYVVQRLLIQSYVETEIVCDSCQSAMLIRTYDEDVFKKWLQKQKV